MTDLIVSPGTKCLTCPAYIPPGEPIVLVASDSGVDWLACIRCAVRIERAFSQ